MRMLCPVPGMKKEQKEHKRMRKENNNVVPIWEKVTLSFEEAKAYSGIGINKLRELTNSPKCNFAIRIGNRTLINRKKFEIFLSQKTVL